SPLEAPALQDAEPAKAADYITLSGDISARPKVSVLIVDDQPANLMALEATLDGLDVNLVLAAAGFEALRCLLNQDFALILMDVKMPEMDGFETAELIRGRKRCAHTPIIFLTASESTDRQIFEG